jgi:hypothetical protein
MVSKDGKLIILDDIVVNKNYAKFKRLESMNVSSGNFYVFRNYINVDSNGTMVSSSDSLSDPYDPDASVTPDDVLNNRFIADSESTLSSLNKVKEKADKDPKSPEAIAYEILTSSDKSYMNDSYIDLSKAIKSKIQKYWDGVEVDIENVRSKKESKFTKALRIAQRSLIKLFKSHDMDVIEMMTEMKDNLELLGAEKDTTDLLLKFIEKMRFLSNNPQVFVAARKIVVMENEKILIKNQKFLKYIKEDQIVEFIKNTEEGLAIDYLSDYSRDIPDEAIKMFEEAEKQEVFDNYIVFHYLDKNERKNLKEHHKEMDKKRDPILFGLIKGSRKLYYICDWIDEYCDLTLSQLIDKIGESEHNLLED